MPTNSPPPANPTVGEVWASGYKNLSEWRAATSGSNQNSGSSSSSSSSHNNSSNTSSSGSSITFISIADTNTTTYPQGGPTVPGSSTGIGSLFPTKQTTTKSSSSSIPKIFTEPVTLGGIKINNSTAAQPTPPKTTVETLEAQTNKNWGKTAITAGYNAMKERANEPTWFAPVLATKQYPGGIESVVRGGATGIYESLGTFGELFGEAIYVGSKQRQLEGQQKINESKTDFNPALFGKVNGQWYIRSSGIKVGAPEGTKLEDTKAFSYENIQKETQEAKTLGRITTHSAPLLIGGPLGLSASIGYTLQSKTKEEATSNLLFGSILGSLGGATKAAATSGYIKQASPALSKGIGIVGDYVAPAGLTAAMGYGISKDAPILFGSDVKASKEYESSLFSTLGAGNIGAKGSQEIITAGITAGRSRALALTKQKFELEDLASKKSIQKLDEGKKFYPQAKDYGVKTPDQLMGKFNENPLTKQFGYKSGGAHVTTADLRGKVTITESKSESAILSQAPDASLPFARTLRITNEKGSSSLFGESQGKNPSINIIFGKTTRIPKNVRTRIEKQASSVNWIEGEIISPLGRQRGKVEVSEADRYKAKLKMFDEYLGKDYKQNKSVIAPTFELGKTEAESGLPQNKSMQQIGLDTKWQKRLGATGYTEMTKEGLFGIKYKTNAAVKFFDTTGKIKTTGKTLFNKYEKNRLERNKSKKLEEKIKVEKGEEKVLKVRSSSRAYSSKTHLFGIGKSKSGPSSVKPYEGSSILRSDSGRSEESSKYSGGRSIFDFGGGSEPEPSEEKEETQPESETTRESSGYGSSLFGYPYYTSRRMFPSAGGGGGSTFGKQKHEKRKVYNELKAGFSILGNSPILAKIRGGKK